MEDFGFLNELASDTQTGIRSDVRRFNKQSDNLGDIISNVNTQIQQSDKKKQDSDFFFTSQANKFAAESDKVTLKIARAKADPWHDLKTLFTDEKSIADYAVEQQKIQNEMNIVQRRYAGAASEYNAELSMIQSELTNAAQQRGLTKDTISTNISAAQGLSTAIASKTNIVMQQFREMTLADMKEELANPSIPNLPRGALEDAIREKEKLQAKLNTTRATRGKSQLDLFNQLAGVLEEHADQIPTAPLEAAVKTGKPVTIPELGVQVTAQQAQRVLESQGKSAIEREDLISSMALNSIRSTNAVRNVSQQLLRAQGGGSDIIIRDPISGLATGIDTSTLPTDERDLFSKMQETNAMLSIIQTEINNGLSGQQLKNATAQSQALQGLIIQTEKELSAATATRAANRYEGKLAKVSASEFNTRGVIESPQGAVQIGTETLSALTSTAVTAETFGAGWSVGMKSVQLMMDNKLKEYASLNTEMQGETEELDTQALIAKMFSTNKQQDLETIFSAALKETNARGDNAVGEIIMQDWLEVGTAHAVNHMINTVHVDDPASQELLQSLLSSDETLIGEITTANDGFSTLFTLLRLKERQAVAAGKLAKESNLVGELQTMLLKDATYQKPFMTSLTSPKKEGAGMLNKLVFNNQAGSVFRQSMKQQVMSIPLANIDQAIDAASNQSLLSQAGDFASSTVESLFNVAKSTVLAPAILAGSGIDALVDENQPQERSVFDTARMLLQNNPDLKPQPPKQ